MNVKRIFGGLCAVLLLFAPVLTVSADETTAATTAEVIITPNPPTPTTTVPEVVITPNPPTVTTTTVVTTTTTAPTTEATTEPDGEIGEPPVIPEWGEEDTTETTTTTTTIRQATAGMQLRLSGAPLNPDRELCTARLDSVLCQLL